MAFKWHNKKSPLIGGKGKRWLLLEEINVQAVASKGGKNIMVSHW
jgi:hypothetical protein